MSFLIKDDELSEKFDSDPVYNENYIKAKKNLKKSYNGKMKTNFYNNKIPKEGSQFIFWSVILMILFLEQIKIIILKCF